MSTKNEKLMKYNEKCVGLFGLGNIFKLAHLPFITVNDVLGVLALEGSSGTGKTTLISRLGMLNNLAGGGDYGVYSADKVKYEDFIGIPVPNMEKRGVDILSMPNSISTKELLLIDEANRASYDAQEKFLQLFSTRKIDGIDVSCRYMYVAMNPVLSEDENDNYEGVQPLDKAYGERVQALLTMPSFHKASKAQQLHIMKSCFDQVTWVPEDEVISLHKEFIEEARNQYEIVKTKYLDGICEYLHTLVDLIHNENRNAIKLQARRVQFILVNILAIHALNLASNNLNASLENSVLETLGISFPHRLWEQPIEFQQIKAAHTNAVHILKDLNELTKKSKAKSQSVEALLQTLKSDIEKNKSSIEDRSKRINQMVADIDIDPFQHYMFPFLVIKTLEDLFGEDLKDSQHLLKENELERFSRIVNTIRNSKEYKKSKKLAKKIKQNPKKNKVSDFLPEWLDEDLDTSALNLYQSVYDDEFTWYLNSVISLSEESGKFNVLNFKLQDCLKNHNTITDILFSIVLNLQENDNA